MDNIIAHGRMDFIKSRKPEGCIFCRGSIRDERLVLCEKRGVFVMMNKFPYNTGHLLIAPLRHISSLEELQPGERVGFFDLLEISIKIIKETMHPEGFNIGVNIGKAAGAGVEDHIHLHVVPRWSGDTNFMTCLADTRVTPEDVAVTCEMLKPRFDKMGGEVR